MMVYRYVCGWEREWVRGCVCVVYRYPRAREKMDDGVYELGCV